MPDDFTAEGYTTDFNKEYFSIHVTACQGGIKSHVSAINGYKPNIHEILGAIEYYKLTLIDRQQVKNTQAAEEYNAKKPD